MYRSTTQRHILNEMICPNKRAIERSVILQITMIVAFWSYIRAKNTENVLNNVTFDKDFSLLRTKLGVFLPRNSCIPPFKPTIVSS